MRIGIHLCDEALALGAEAISTRAFGLAASLREQLATVPGVTLRDLGTDKCAIVTFSHEKLEAAAIKQLMAEEGINVSASLPSSTRLDAEKRNLPVVLRVSPHYYNTEDELDRFCQVLKRAS